MNDFDILSTFVSLLLSLLMLAMARALRDGRVVVLTLIPSLSLLRTAYGSERVP